MHSSARLTLAAQARGLVATPTHRGLQPYRRIIINAYNRASSFELEGTGVGVLKQGN